MPPRLAALAALGLALGGASVARAHGAAEEVRPLTDGWAVRVRDHGGRPLAGATFQVIAPGPGGLVVREGKTPADGWVELRPDAPGTWLVKIVDGAGHGKTVKVEVPAGSPAIATPNPSTSTTTTTTTSTTTSTIPTPTATAEGASPLRIALGAAAIALVFLVAAALGRRRRAAGR